MFGFDLGGIARGVTEGVLAPLFTWLNKKQDVSLEKYKVDGQVDLSLVNADIALVRAQKEFLIASLAYKGDRYLRYLFGYPVGIWWAAYFLDSTFRTLSDWSFRVLTPEPAIMTWVGWIIGALFLHSAVTTFWRR